MPGESANPTWSDKRERQYEHIKEGLLDRGEDEDTAEEIAARTVNKERAQHGEAMEPSRTSVEDISRSCAGAGADCGTCRPTIREVLASSLTDRAA